MTRAEGFASVPTWMIRDSDVSVHALTVYASLSSRSGLREIIPGRETLAREARCSVRQVARALTELEGLGVIRRVRRKNSTGRAPNGYTLHPNGAIPVEDVESLTAEVEALGRGGRGLGEQGYGTQPANHTSYRGRDSEAEKDEVERATVVAVEPDVFEQIWVAWHPKRRGASKVGRAKLSAALKVVDVATIVDAVRRDVAVWRTWPPQDFQFIPLLSTWLSQGRWEESSAAQPRGTVRSFAQQKQDSTLALVARYQEEERHAEVGNGDAAGVRAIAAGA